MNEVDVSSLTFNRRYYRRQLVIVMVVPNGPPQTPKIIKTVASLHFILFFSLKLNNC